MNRSAKQTAGAAVVVAVCVVFAAFLGSTAGIDAARSWASAGGPYQASVTPDATATITPTLMPTVTLTALVTPTLTPAVTLTAVVTPTSTATATISATPTVSPTVFLIYLPYVANPCVDEVGESSGERQSCYGRPGDPSGHIVLLGERMNQPQPVWKQQITLYQVLGWTPDPPGAPPMPTPVGANTAPLTPGRCRTMASRVDELPPPGVADTWRFEPTADPALLATMGGFATVEPAVLASPGALTNPTLTDPNGWYGWYVMRDGCYFVEVSPLMVTGTGPHYSPIVGAGPSFADANDVHHCYAPPSVVPKPMQWGSGKNPFAVCTPFPPP